VTQAPTTVPIGGRASLPRRKHCTAASLSSPLPEFKQLVRNEGLVDYWRVYGWPDLCRPLGDDDFQCR